MKGMEGRKERRKEKGKKGKATIKEQKIERKLLKIK